MMAIESYTPGWLDATSSGPVIGIVSAPRTSTPVTNCDRSHCAPAVMVDWPTIASVPAISRAKRLAGMRRNGPKIRSATPSGRAAEGDEHLPHDVVAQVDLQRPVSDHGLRVIGSR